MLKQLYKHEFLALLRWALLIWGGVIAMAILNRGTMEIFTLYMKYAANNDNSMLFSILTSLTGSMIALFVFASFAGIIITMGLVVVRFYKNLFTKEGYFTFTIPVKTVDHIWCKLLCGGVIICASFVVTAIAIFITLVGTDVGISIAQGFSETIIEGVSEIGLINVVFFIIELLILILAGLLTSNLTYYCAISFGQGFKNKIGGSILSYLIINAIMQAVSSFISIFGTLFMLLIMPSDVLNGFTPELFLHLSLILAILWIVGFGAIFFAVTAKRTSKNLNLE